MKLGDHVRIKSARLKRVGQYGIIVENENPSPYVWTQRVKLITKKEPMVYFNSELEVVPKEEYETAVAVQEVMDL